MKSALSHVHDLETNLQNEINALVVVFDTNDKIIGFNKRCEQLTGYSFEEVKGHSIYDLFLVNGESHCGAEYYKPGQTNPAPYKYTNRWKAKNGQELVITWSNHLLKDGSQRSTHIIATGSYVIQKPAKDDQQLSGIEQQEIINNLLFIMMEDIEFSEKLKRSLSNIKSASWLNENAELEFFLLRPEAGAMVLKRHDELDKPSILPSSEVVHRDNVCQKAIQSGHSDFCQGHHGHYSGADNKLELRPYYSIPIKSSNTVLAVLVIYLEPGHLQDIREIFFLRTVANAITVTIERFNSKNILDSHDKKSSSDTDSETYRNTDSIKNSMDNPISKQELRLTNHVFESVQESVIVCDKDKNIIKINHTYSSITGFHKDDVIGNQLFASCSEKHDKDFYDNIWNEIRSVGSWHGEIWNKCKNGDEYPEWRTITAVTDEHGEINHYIAISMDISEKKESEQRINQLAHYDQLTNLPNKQLFQQILNDKIIESKTAGEQLAILFFDLDGLKRINDSMGHHTGDDVLKIMAQRLCECTHKQGIVSRWASDEFVMALPYARQTEEVTVMINDIYNQLIEPITFNDQKQLVVGSSIGVSLYPEDGNTAISLIQNAAMAMHKTKNNGGNSYQFYTAEMNIAVIERLGIETGLRSALEFDQFELYYQPLVNLKNKNIISAEALIRWNHPKRGVIPPDNFIPVAEDSDLIIPIGEWVLNKACTQCKEWQDNGQDNLQISVNLSAIQFRDKNLFNMVSNALSISGLDPSQLTLELTESAIMDNIQQTIESLNMLKEIGVSLSIDDFGTGYSSLAYLKRFPIDKLKIDRSFVKDVDLCSEDISIVKSIITLGHNLKMSVIAEGIEKPAHLHALDGLQCEEGQGYFISEPLPASQFHDFIQQWQNNAHPQQDLML